jgi:hypothetical protein
LGENLVETGVYVITGFVEISFVFVQYICTINLTWVTLCVTQVQNYLALSRLRGKTNSAAAAFNRKGHTNTMPGAKHDQFQTSCPRWQ